MSREEKDKLDRDLSEAYRRKDKDEVQRLVDDFVDRTYSHNMRIYWEIQYGDDKEVESLLSDVKTNMNWTNEYDVGWSFMHHAAIYDKLKMLGFIFKNGGDSNIQDIVNQTPLFYCTSSQAAQLLLDNGAQSEQTNEANQTPLFNCSSSQVARLLLDNGAQLEHTDIVGEKPLHRAAALDREDVVDVLLRHGSSLTSRNNVGETALDIAKRKNSHKCVTILEDAMKKQGEDINDEIDKHDDRESEAKTDKQHTAVPDYRKLLDTAKAEGFVTTKWTNISVVGASGTGKSSMLNLLLNKEPILEHHSTPVVKAAEVLVVDEDPNTDSDESSSSLDESTEEEDGDETVSEIGQHVIIADTSGCWKATNGETTKTKLAQALKQRIQPKSSAGLPHKPIPLMKITKRNMERLASQLLPESRPEVDDDMNTKLQHYPMSHANMELLELLYSVRQSEELYKCHWIYVADSGGQAAFLDIAPALMRYNSANLIVIKLDEKLDSLADFFYSVHGRKVGEGEKRKITTMQLIKNFFYCKSQLKMPHLEGVENVQQHGETCFLILATHLDKYKKLKKSKKLQESLEKKNECLLNHLQSYRDVRRDYKSSKKQIIFPLNTLSREKKQLKTAKKIRDLTAESYIEGEVPVRWFIFHIDLQQKSSGCNMISLDECYQIGESSNMKPDEVKAALCYFHSLTVYLYFHSILPLVVFINPQPLFDRLSEIMAVSFGSSRHSAQTIEDLQNKGIFKRKLLDGMEFEKHLFTADDFLKLMKELLVISELHDNSGYFIPCVLKIDDEPYEPVSDNDIEPLILVWENASIPNGLFPALVVHLLGLVSSQVRGLDYRKQFWLGDEIYRNKVTLKCRDLGGTMVLVDHVDWLAIFYFGPFKNCSTIRCLILRGLVEVITRFEWKSALANPHEMFQCKCTVVLPSVFHLCEYNKESATLTCCKSKVCIKGSVERHLSWFCEEGCEDVQFAQAHSEMDIESSMKRTHDDIIGSHKRGQKRHHQDNYDSLVGLKKPALQANSYEQSKPGTCTSSDVQSEHDTPLEKSDSISYEDLLDKPPETKDVYNLVKYISALWNELGREFDVPENDRTSLRTNINLSDEDRLESVLSKWIRTETTTVKWRVVLEALNALERKDIIKKVITYLEKPETYRKYISMRDFFPCPI